MVLWLCRKKCLYSQEMHTEIFSGERVRMSKIHFHLVQKSIHIKKGRQRVIKLIQQKV